jgi:DNA-binding CsgD family transcriptional regulator
VLNSVFLFIYVTTAFIFAWYVITLLGLKFRMKKTLLMLFFLPEIIVFFLLALNSVFRWVYYYDANGIYLHGKMMYVLYGTGYLYLLIAAFLLIRFGGFLIRAQRNAAILFLVLSIVPIIIQQFFIPHYLIELFFQSIAIFGFLITVENFDAIHNPGTNVYNRATFLQEIDLIIRNKRPFDVVIVKLSRSCYFDVATLEAYHAGGFIASVAEWLNSLSKRIDVYDCERGHFVLLINHSDDYNIEELTQKICDRFTQKWKYQNREIQFPIELCVTNIPKEMLKVEQLVQIADHPYLNKSMEPVIIAAKELEKEWQEPTASESMHQQLGTEVSAMLDNFVFGVSLLTPAEYNIFRHYIDGHEITEIPELEYVSINTVRKHNKSIYKKLAVSSKEELVFYVDFLRRSNRLNELDLK